MDWKPLHPEQKSSNWSSLLQTVMDFLPVSSFRYSCYASDGCNGDLLCLCHHRYCHHLHLQVSQTCLYLCTEYENWTYDPIATPADLSLNHYTHAAHQAQKERKARRRNPHLTSTKKTLIWFWVIESENEQSIKLTRSSLMHSNSKTDSIQAGETLLLRRFVIISS